MSNVSSNQSNSGVSGIQSGTQSGTQSGSQSVPVKKSNKGLIAGVLIFLAIVIFLVIHFGVGKCNPACIKGNCTNGKCVCSQGFSGNDCNTPTGSVKDETGTSGTVTSGTGTSGTGTGGGVGGTVELSFLDQIIIAKKTENEQKPQRCNICYNGLIPDPKTNDCPCPSDYPVMCFNGSTRDEKTGKCICPTGFSGESCEKGIIKEHYLVYNKKRSFTKDDVNDISKKYNANIAQMSNKFIPDTPDTSETDKSINLFIITKQMTQWCNSGYILDFDTKETKLIKVGKPCTNRTNIINNNGIILYGIKPPRNASLSDDDVIAPFYEKNPEDKIQESWNCTIL